MTEYLLIDDKIEEGLKQETCDGETYEEYANQLGIHLQDAINIARYGAALQLAKCEEKAKPVWRREAVEMAFERIRDIVESTDEEVSPPVPNFYIRETKLKSLQQELLDKIDKVQGG